MLIVYCELFVFFLDQRNKSKKAKQGNKIVYPSEIIFPYITVLVNIPCVSLDSSSFVIYPEINANEVRFSASKALPL